jgi:cobaltochelatase CobS
MSEEIRKEFISCALCGSRVHSVSAHLKEFHPDVTIADYQRLYPEAPILSAWGKLKVAEFRQKLADKAKAQAQKEEAKKHVVTADKDSNKEVISKVFGLPSDICKNKLGEEIAITVLNDSDNPKTKSLVPEVSNNYVYDIKELKYQLMALELNTPCLVWGHKGCGKTEGIEQICARTNRSFMRIQHTANTEEAHIVGQWIVKNGETVYQLGALSEAMLYGWVYCADEYDFTPPHVLSVYQSVLEGKPLVIKDAPEEYRIIKPHKNFRFFATGNTNGTGDETGSYAGTLTQNSANYDRFGIVVHKEYLPKEKEIEILTKKTGIRETEAKLLVEFAQAVRKAYGEGKINDTISPRALINAGKIGILIGDLTQGLKLAFTNKLSSVDEEVCLQYAQRIFGSGEAK